MAVSDTAQLTFFLDDLLNRSSREDITNLEGQVRSMFAYQNRSVNDQYSPFLKLPPELKLWIGKLVLGTNDYDRFKSNGKKWFKRILPLLQTCARLRLDLHPLRYEPAILYYSYLPLCRRDLQRLRDMLASWHKDGPHRGPVTIHLSYLEDDCLSTAAAFAGGLEYMLFGRLSDPPAIYVDVVGTNSISWTAGTVIEDCVDEVRVGHSREKNMQACCGETPNGEWRVLSAEEGAQIWEQARKEGWE